MEKYILSFLRENTEDKLISRYIYMLKNELDFMLYGNNNSFSGRNAFVAFSKYNMWKGNVKYKLHKFLKPMKLLNEGVKNVLTTNTFGSVEDFAKYGIQLMSTDLRSPLFVVNDKPIRELRNIYSSMMRSGTFLGMLKRDNLERLEALKDDVADALVRHNIKAFFTQNDEEFWNKYMIEVCKKAGIPSFELLHGLPGAYTLDFNSRTDYLCVWGDVIKKNYIANGFEADRIFVTGAPRFSQFEKPIEFLRNSIDDVLVATTAACNWLQHGWIMDEYGDQNDSLLLLYIYQVQNVLKKLGIKHARLRPHQSVDKHWVSKYVDTDFYQLDYESVNDSLRHSTMVIGPHSTLILDSLTNGVNYYVYDPGENGRTVKGAKNVPPFDGSNKYIKLAQTEEELFENIKQRVLIDSRFLDGYLNRFDLSPILNLF